MSQVSHITENLRLAHLYRKRYLTEQQRTLVRENLASALSSIEIEHVLNFVQSCNEVPDFLNGGWCKTDITLLVMYWMVRHECARSRHLKRMFGIPRCTFFKCLQKLQPGLALFNEANIVWGTLEQRKTVADATMPSSLSHCTGIIDGVHVHVKVRNFFCLIIYLVGKEGTTKHAWNKLFKLQNEKMEYLHASDCQRRGRGNLDGQR